MPRLATGSWQCTQCGEIITNVPGDGTPRAILVGHGGSPNQRVLVFRGTEVHRCRVGPGSPVATPQPRP